jgi:general stress protein YciG
VEQETINAVMRELGTRGGKRRMQALSKKQRAELGRLAGQKSGEARRAKAALKKTPPKKAAGEK